MVNEELIVWNPLKQNPFSRFDNELHFVEMHYQKDFVLVFEDIKFSKKCLKIFTFFKKIDNVL